MANITWRAANTLNARKGECVLKLNGKSYNILHLKNIEATLDYKKAEVNVLNKTMTGHKLVSESGKFKASIFMVESEMRAAAQEFKDSGSAPIYEIQIANEDPSVPDIGRQEVILKDCMSDSLVLAKLDADGEQIEEDIEGTFDDWEMPEGFNLLDGMEITNG